MTSIPQKKLTKLKLSYFKRNIYISIYIYIFPRGIISAFECDMIATILANFYLS